jgi:hypothetical protein
MENTIIKENEMENNPLRQYFRRPAVYLKLPSGGLGYDESVLTFSDTNEYPVYPMTAIDEITSKTPDALFNGSAVVDLIKSCVPNFKDPWGVQSNDLDAILIALRAASGSEKLEMDTACPSCETISSYGVDLVNVLSTLESGDYTKELEVRDLKIKFRPLTYKEMNVFAIQQFELQKLFITIDSSDDEDEKVRISKEAIKRVTEITMELLSQSIEFIQTPSGNVTEKEFIHDFLKNCDNSMYEAIRAHNATLKLSTEIKPLDIKCESCEHEYKQSFALNPSDFFG